MLTVFCTSAEGVIPEITFNSSFRCLSFTTCLIQKKREVTDDSALILQLWIPGGDQGHST